MAGKITLISFIYTLCSNEKGCPLSMATLFDIYHASARAPGLRNHVQMLTISFDPRNDTPRAMAAYGAAVLADSERGKKINWQFLTATSDRQLRPVLAAYGQQINRRTDGETIDHLLRLYLVDRNGLIRNIYGLGFMDPRLLYADIYTLLIEEGTIAKGRP